MASLRVLLLLTLLIAFSNLLVEGKRWNKLRKALQASYSYTNYETTAYDEYTCSSGSRFGSVCFGTGSVSTTYVQAKKRFKVQSSMFADFSSAALRKKILKQKRGKGSDLKKGYIFLFYMSDRSQEKYIRRYFYVNFKLNHLIVMEVPSGRILVVSQYTKVYTMSQMKSCKKNRWRCRDNKRCIKQKYRCDGVYDCDDNSDEKDCGCGGTLTAKTGTINSPKYPKKYPNNVKCDWVLDIKDVDTIFLTFNEWNVEHEDVLEIIGENDDVVFSGYDKLKGKLLQYTGDVLRLRFESDDSGRKKGFSIKYQSVKKAVNEWTTSVIRKIELTRGFKIGYRMTWIYTSSTKFITYQLTNFYLDPTCSIAFYSAKSASSSALISKHAADGTFNVFGIFAMSNSLFVELTCGNLFTIDPKKFRFGARVTDKCSMVIDASKGGVISTPSDKNKFYPKDVACEYKFINLYAKTRFVIEMFEIRGPEAYVEFNGKRYTSHSSLQAAFEAYTITKGSTLTIKFVSAKNAFTGKGFRISYSISCMVRGVEIRYNEMKTITAPANQVFGGRYTTKAAISVRCLKGGMLSQSITTYRKVCRGQSFSKWKFSVGVAVGYSYYAGTRKTINACYSGFSMSGSSTLQCTVTGWKWTLKCIQVMCPMSMFKDQLQAYNVAGRVVSVIPANSYVECRCSDSANYRLDHEYLKYVFCDQRGKLTALPKCISKKCRVPKVIGRFYKWEKQGEEIEVGKSVKMKCHKNYKLKLGIQYKLKCERRNGLLITTIIGIVSGLADCVAEDVCKANPSICGMGKCRRGPGGIGYECICNSGYKVYGPPGSETCIDVNECTDAEYKGRMANCHKCHNKMGTFSCTCRSGYQVYKKSLKDYAKKHFPKDYKEMKEDQYCIEKECPVFKPAKATVVDKKRILGAVIRFRCDKGYHAGGKFQMKVTCSSSGSSMYWKGMHLGCVKGLCPKEHYVDHGSLNIIERGNKNTAVLNCDSGYKSNEKNPTYECKEKRLGHWKVDFKWSGKAKCEPLQKCSSLGVLKHGKIKIMGSMAWYMCDKNYNLKGSPLRFCKHGKWTLMNNKVPSCMRPSCPALVTGKNIKILRKNSTDISVHFACRAMGYKMVGDSHLRCHIKDRWIFMANMTSKSAFFCDKTSHLIGCPLDKVIQPLYAKYGYEMQQVHGCSGGGYSNKSCGDSAKSLEIIEKSCGGKRICWVSAAPQMFNYTSQNAICEGKQAVLELTYMCVKKEEKVKRTYAFLACNHIVPGLAEKLSTSKMINKTELDTFVTPGTGLCAMETRRQLIQCMYDKASVLKKNEEILEFHLQKTIVMSLCPNGTNQNVSNCIQCFNILKYEGKKDLCSPNLHTCLLKTCWNSASLNQTSMLAKYFSALYKLYSMYTTARCNKMAHISTKGEKNLLENNDLAPAMYNGMAQRHVEYKGSDGNWTMKSAWSGHQLKLNMSMKGSDNAVTLRVSAKFLTRVEVEKIYLQLTGAGVIDLSTLKASGAITVASNVLSLLKFEAKMVRGDLIEIEMKKGFAKFSAISIELSVKKLYYMEANLIMGFSYEKPKDFEFINCYSCKNENKEENCLKMVRCNKAESQCYSVWKKTDTGIFVSKGCGAKNEVAKWVGIKKCYDKTAKLKDSCTSACASNFCNGYGICPAWVKFCSVDNNLEIYNVTLKVSAEFRDISKTCMTKVSDFFFKEIRLLWASFNRESCKETKSTITQTFKSDRRMASVHMTIRRTYSDMDGVTCRLSYPNATKPFQSVMANWNKAKAEKICDGAVKIDTLTHQKFVFCSYGSVYNAANGWCEDSAMPSPKKNALLNSNITKKVTIEGKSKKAYILDDKGQFELEKGGDITLSATFWKMLYVTRFTVKVFGGACTIKEVGDKKPKAREYVENKKVLTTNFTRKIEIECESSGKYKVFLSLEVLTVKRLLYCYKCEKATAEDQCTSQVICAGDDSSCYTTWKSGAKTNFLYKGCKSMTDLAKMKNSSQCGGKKMDTASAMPPNCTSTCNSNRCNAYSICPAWQPSCQPGINLHKNSVKLFVLTDVKQKGCRQVIHDQLKKIIESTWTIFSAPSRCNETKLSHSITGVNNGTHISYTLATKYQYFAYNLPACFNKNVEKELLKNLRSVLLTHSPVKIPSCVHRNVIAYKLLTINVTRCAFYSTQRSYRYCTNPNVLPMSENIIHESNLTKTLNVTSESGEVLNVTKQGYIKVKAMTSYNGTIQFTTTAKITRLVLHLFGSGMGISSNKTELKNNSHYSQQKMINFTFKEISAQASFSFYIHGLNMTEGMVTIGLKAKEAVAPTTPAPTTAPNRTGTIGRRRRKRSTTTSPLPTMPRITRDANLTETATNTTKVISNTPVRVNMSDYSPSTNYKAGWIGVEPYCVDIEKPKPRRKQDCHSPRIFDERGEKPLRGLIALKSIWPSFMDNSGEEVTTRVIGHNYTKFTKLDITEWSRDITFEGTDKAGNSHRCNITVQWRDVTNPTVTCPPMNYIQKVNVSSRMAPIILPTINASDANGLKPFVYSIANGTMLSLDVPTQVNITVNDTRDNSIQCHYYHTIESTECHPDAFPYVSRTNMTVTSTLTTFPTRFYQVQVSCARGYSLGETFAQQLSFMCLPGGKLQFPDELKGHTVIPPCLLTTASYKLIYKVELVNTISPTCCTGGFKEKNITAMMKEKVGCLSFLSRKLALKVTSVASGGFGSPEICRFTFDISFKYDYSESNNTQLTMCGTEIVNYLRNRTVGLSASSLKCGSPNLTVSTDPITSGAACEPGSVSQNKSVLLCVPCKAGSYYNMTLNKCQVCGVDTYQDKDRMEMCKPCPANKGTLKENSRSSSECLPKCSLGSYKIGRAIEPCIRCPVGNYSDMIGSTSCKACPKGTTTANEGGSSVKDCKSPCVKGHFSTTAGLSPCLPCPKGSYQDKEGQMSCSLCPMNTTTARLATISKDLCKAIDPCANHTCVNGSCVVQPAFEFSCSCTPGFTGDNCDTMVNLCAKNPCQFGNCSAMVNTYTCSCQSGYYGRDCNMVDYCHSKPCMHNSTCVNGNSSYTCQNCSAPYTGMNCDELIDPCSVNPCKNSGVCSRDGNSTSYTCNCTGNFQGPTCETTLDVCASTPCGNGGVCNSTANGTYSCNCTSGWTGSDCTVDINECAANLTNPCANNGTCVNVDGGFSCDCAAGYMGANCSQEINECLSTPCMNGATCMDLVASFNCTCLPGFKGSICNEIIDNCSPNPCNATGTLQCISKLNSYECKCRNSYKGKTCDQFISYCTPTNPCFNNSKCVEGSDVQNIYNRSASTKYHCQCPSYRGGQNCEMQLDTCIGHACRNGASCVNGTTAYTCQCPRGFNGTFCQNAINQCDLDKPCANGGTCSPTVGNFTCACVAGWTGRTCTEQFDNCLSKPCLNGASCKNLFNSYECTCLSGFSGPTCETRVNVCETKPCKNGGSCFQVTASAANGTNVTAGLGYTCSCPPGFNGTQCENNIDDCPVPSPCQNGGVCKDLVNKYVCTCASVFEGKHCNKTKSGFCDLLFQKTSSALDLNVMTSVNVSSRVLIWSLSSYVRSFTSAKSNFLKISASSQTILEIGTDRLTYSVKNSSINESFTAITPGKWTHILVNVEPKRFLLYFDGVLSKNVSKIDPGLAIDNYTLTFGNADNASDFKGQLTQVYWRSANLNDTQIAAFRTANCSQYQNSPPEVSADILLEWRLMCKGQKNSRVSQCGSSTCPPGFSGSTCGSEEDKEAPKVTYCPTAGITYINDTSSASVVFKEPVFTDNVAVTTITKSHRSGDILRPGIHSVVWTAADAAGNEATCQFKISFVKYKCEPQTAPNNDTAVTCLQYPDGTVVCQSKCKDTTRYAISGSVSSFSCSPAAGGWSPKSSGIFEVPRCVLQTPATSSAKGSVTVALPQANTCAAQQADILKAFLTMMKNLRALKASLCKNPDCSDLASKAVVSCPGARRRKRAAGSATVTYSLPNGDAASNDMCNAVRAGTATHTGAGGISMRAGACPSVTPTCTNGNILSGTTCVACPAGTYHKSAYDTICTPCPLAKYNDVQGATVCKDCPAKQTTPGVGATTADYCYTVCPAGQFMDTTSGACKDCPAGSFSAAAGQAQCLVCPQGAAAAAGSTGCKQCAAGQQLAASGSCESCPKGFYRPNDPRQSVCQACSSGKTTSGVGATSAAACNVPVCPAGQFQESGACKKCYVGTYQPRPGQNTCLRCAAGNTTSAAGATKASDCKPGLVNECKVGSAYCDKHADCIDTPASFSCKCKKPNWQGNGFRCSCAPGYVGPDCNVQKKKEGMTSTQKLIIALVCVGVVLIFVGIGLAVYIKHTRYPSSKGKTASYAVYDNPYADSSLSRSGVDNSAFEPVAMTNMASDGSQ